MKNTKKLAIILALAIAFLLAVQIVLGTAPTSANNTVTTSEDTNYIFSTADFSFADTVDGNSFASVQVITLETIGALKLSSSDVILNQLITVSDLSAGNLVFVPVANANGAPYDSFQFRVWDSANETSAAQIMVINVSAVNDAPVAANDSVTVFAEVTTTVNVLGNDNDVDGDTLTLESVTTPAKGAVVVNGNSVDYTANQGFDGTDTFNYAVNDGKGGTSTATVTVTVKRVLSIESVKINGKTSGDLNLEDINDVEVNVQNDFTKDLLEVVVTATLLNVDNDDLEEESDEFDLDAGDEERLDFEFDLKGKDLDDESYTLEVAVEGKDSSGKKYRTVEKFSIDVDREKHQVIIRKVDLQATNLQCSNLYTSISVSIKNIGKSDEDDVEIRVRNSALNIDLSKSDLELDKFSGRDNDYKTNFALDLTAAEAGRHTFSVEVFRDGDLDDREELSVTVQGCDSASNYGLIGNEVMDLQRKLQEGLQERSLLEKSVVENTLMESKSYTLLLGFLVVLTFVAIVLALAVLTVKK